MTTSRPRLHLSVKTAVRANTTLLPPSTSGLEILSDQSTAKGLIQHAEGAVFWSGNLCFQERETQPQRPAERGGFGFRPVEWCGSIRSSKDTPKVSVPPCSGCAPVDLMRSRPFFCFVLFNHSVQTAYSRPPSLTALSGSTWTITSSLVSLLNHSCAWLSSLCV